MEKVTNSKRTPYVATVAGPSVSHDEKNVRDYMHIVTHFGRDHSNFLYQWTWIVVSKFIDESSR